MFRLDQFTVGEFAARRGVAAILFGAARGQLTMDQAREFAFLWLEYPDLARYGYINVTANLGVCKLMPVKSLPTVLISEMA